MLATPSRAIAEFGIALDRRAWKSHSEFSQHFCEPLLTGADSALQ